MTVRLFQRNRSISIWNGWKRLSLSIAASVTIYPKYVVSLDELAAGNVNGAKIMYLADFLMSSEY